MDWLERNFYLDWAIGPTPSGQLQARVKCGPVSGEPDTKKLQTAFAKIQPLVPVQLGSNAFGSLFEAFPLSWSHYVRRMFVEDDIARSFSGVLKALARPRPGPK